MSNTRKTKTPQPWKTDNWFVSAWNYLEEVTQDFNPPEVVKIHDITLRDGEQQAGIIFTKDDKIRISEKLSKLGFVFFQTIAKDESCPQLTEDNRRYSQPFGAIQ